MLDTRFKLLHIPGREKLLSRKSKLLIDGTNLWEGDTSPEAKVWAKYNSTISLYFLHKGTIPIVIIRAAC